MDLVPAGGEVEARRGGCVLLDPLPQPQEPRQREQESNEGPAHHRADGPEEASVRRAAHDLGRLQRDGGPVSSLGSILGAFAPKAFRIERSATIKAPASAVFAQVNDFQNWRAWSPWEKLDPALKRSYAGPAAGTGSQYAWIGNKNVGQGRMTILDSRAGELV